MKVAEQTQQQIERFLKKIAQKFTASDCNLSMTDLHLRASQDNEITRCVIEEWIDNKSDNFYPEIALVLRSEMNRVKDIIENLSIMKPYSFVLEDDDKNCITELYLVDDDLGIIGGDLMQGLDKDLDSFLQNILKEDA